VLFWNSVDLESKLSAFRDYYHRERVHSVFTAELTALRPSKSAEDRARNQQT